MRNAASEDAVISYGRKLNKSGISKKFPQYIKSSATKSVRDLESKIAS
ncbi:hypothetical protein KAS08_04370 [Candidatus Pacearchaeota archaeon]|nr:hypothetical protein [Candidatus Pacearchaeota archaeon]